MHNTHEEHYTSKTPICNLFANLNGKVLLKRVYPIKKRNSAVFNRFFQGYFKINCEKQWNSENSSNKRVYAPYNNQNAFLTRLNAVFTVQCLPGLAGNDDVPPGCQ